MSVYHLWKTRWNPAKTAINFHDKSWTYGALVAEVDRNISAFVAEGLSQGDVVALQGSKDVRFIVAHLAALAMGIVTLPLQPNLTADQLRYYLLDSGAKRFVGDAPKGLNLPQVPCLTYLQLRHKEAPPELPQPQPNDLAVLLYTSGTTGNAKGAMLSHANLIAMVESLREAWSWSSDDHLLHALPIFHVHGLFVAQHGALAAGATSTWLTRFSAEQVHKAIASQSITLFMGVPTYYHRLLASVEPADWSGVRLCTSGSAPLPPAVHQAFFQRFHKKIVERYGMTEVGIVISNTLTKPMPGAIGRPLGGVRAKVTDESGNTVEDGVVGELRIKGPSVFRGYLNQPQKTSDALVNGWMRTGDFAMQQKGVFSLVGRRSDLILSGGENVYPAQLELHLLKLDGVSEGVVIGLPHPDFGEGVCVVYVGAATQHSVAEHMSSLQPHQRAKYVFQREALPRNAMGKIQRHLLRAQLGKPTVRVAVHADAPWIVANILQLAQTTEGLTLVPEVVTEAVQKILQGDASATYLIAEIGRVSVGQLMWTTEFSDWRNGEYWWIQSVFVPPMMRKRGVFSCLLRHLRELAKAADALALRLYVDRSNDAVEVYEHLGLAQDHYLMMETKDL